MIEVFAGRLGGGKSYHASLRIAEHLSKGHSVYTNIEMIFDKLEHFISERWGVEIEKEQLHQLTGEEIGNFHRTTPPGTFESPVLIVVDEAHIWLNARDWNKASRDLMNYLTQSRKQFNDIIFISQHEFNVDKQIARLVQYVWRFRDMKKFKVAGLGGWPFDQFMLNQFDYDGKTLLERRIRWKDKAVYGIYNSHALLSTIDRGVAPPLRRTLKKSANRRNKMIRMLIPVFVLALLFAGYKAYRIFVKHENPLTMKTKGKEPEQPKPIASASPISEKKKPAFLVETETLRAMMPAYLKTNKGEYQQGEMSRAGYVETIKNNVARIKTPSGETLFIVAESVGQAGENPLAKTPATTTETTTKETVIAGWDKPENKLYDNERSRISGEIRQPLPTNGGTTGTIGRRR